MAYIFCYLPLFLLLRVYYSMGLIFIFCEDRISLYSYLIFLVKLMLCLMDLWILSKLLELLLLLLSILLSIYLIFILVPAISLMAVYHGSYDESTFVISREEQKGVVLYFYLTELMRNLSCFYGLLYDW